mgnify:CR=1 FL=1
MGDARWTELRGKEVRHRDRRWELTGDVEVQESGAVLALRARNVDDVRHEEATLYFDRRTDEDTLNPGDLGEHFDSIERRGQSSFLVVKKDGRTYRYKLRRLEHA